MSYTLWWALGRPPPSSPVPGPESAEWTTALASLHRSAAGMGLTLSSALTSWHDLWAATRGLPPPPLLTWASLCDGLFIEDAAPNPCQPSQRERRSTGSVTPLWVALGRPPHHLGVQGRHSEEWRRAADSLRCHLIREGVSFAPPILRSWRRLWISCHGSQPPAAATWAQLCHGRTLASLSPLSLSPDDATPFPLASWNIRWLVDANSLTAQHKRAALRKHLHLGRVTCIQETHWASWTAEQWKNLFPTSAVHWTPGIPTAKGSVGGGTAILVPHHFKSQGSELVRGCAVQALCTAPGQPPVRVISIYLPKGAQSTVIQQLGQRLAPFGGPTYFSGDFNLDLISPRGHEEANAVARLKALFSKHGAILMPTAPTRWENASSSTIDGVAVPAPWAKDAHVVQTFEHSISDHACLVVAPQQSRRRTRPCNPATLRSLPPEAFVDLRRRFGQLEVMFGIPTAPIPRQPSHGPAPCQVGTLHHDNPATALDPGAAGAPPSRDGQPTPPDRTPIRADPELVKHGHRTLCSMLDSWWELWKHRSPRDYLLCELKDAAFGRDSVRPTDTLRHWMSEYTDEPPTTLQPDEARAWIATYLESRQPRRNTSLSARRQPSWRRPPPHEHHVLGRGLYRKTYTLKGIKGPDGLWTDSPELVQDILWTSRADIWATIHPHSQKGAAVLSAYTTGRVAELPSRPTPSLEEIAGAILAAGNAAPGPDGWPYEVFHCGVNFTAHLIGQAILSTGHDSSQVDSCLGPNNDLLIWIPKKANADTVDGQRPLQLPNCLRRLFGATIMATVGPAVEPHFSDFQAAVRGGSCEGNIRKAYDHLQGRPGHGPTRQSNCPGPLWDAVLGDLATPADLACRQGAGLNAAGRAVFLADQSKAFERLSLSWLHQVMCAWSFPQWVRRALLSLVKGRTVCTRVNNRLSAPKAVQRGIGMGGPASPFLWNLAFDPLAVALHQAVGAEPPTYVDDLAALTSDALQMLRAQTFLVAAAHIAGLKADVHSCTQLEGKAHGQRIRSLLAPLPVKVTVRDDGGFSIKGLPATYLRPLLRAANPDYVEGCTVRSSPCKCKVKSMVIPARHSPAWECAMCTSVFGAGAIHSFGPYLGVTLASPDLPLGGNGTRANAAHARAITWEAATDKLCARAEELCGKAASPTLRASHWNTYMVPIVLYPAQLANPPSLAVQRILRAQASLFRTEGWASGAPQLLPLLGGFLRLKGAPRCPLAAAHTSSLLALLGKGAWGPEHLLSGTQELWDRCKLWASLADEDWWGPRTTPVKDVVRQLAQLQTSRSDGQGIRRDLLRKAARQVYLALLLQIDRGRSQQWFERKGNGRVGTALSLLRLRGVLHHANGFTAGLHAVRLLLGTYKGLAGRRSADTRINCPRSCHSCRSPEVARVWVTPGQGHRGVAWCSNCLPDCAESAPPWVIAWRAYGDTSRTPLDDAALAAPPSPEKLQDSTWVHTASAYSACPLCGRGEAGSEHLCHWCPAVALAWTLVFPDVPYTALSPPAGEFDFARFFALCQHVVFLYGSLNGNATTSWVAAGYSIARAVRMHLLGDPSDDPNEDWRDALGGPAPARQAPVWAPAFREGCPTCRLSVPAELKVGSAPAGKPGWDMHTRNPVDGVATARVTCFPGDCLAALTAPNAPAHWIHRHGWFPIPRELRGGGNAHWVLFGCRDCHAVRADLVASAHIRGGEEITVAAPQVHITGPSVALSDVEVSFDGSCRKASQGNGGGAAAVFWSRPDHRGDRHILKVLCVALGGEQAVPTTEAWGLRLALTDLCRRGRSREPILSQERTARLIGDNVSVIRYGASQGRLRRHEQAGLLEGPLTEAALQGWDLTWLPVHRSLNGAADFFAKHAAQHAPSASSSPLFFSPSPHLFSHP